MSLSFDLFWSFRSPYSYLATGRMADLEREYDVSVNVRPVYPIAIRIDDFFKNVNPLWPPYLLQDTVRIAQMLDIPYGWPNPDPVVQDFETREIPKEQPYIYQLTRLGAAAALDGKGLPFIDEVSKIIWSGTVQNWHDGDHLKNAARRAGVDLEQMERAISANTEQYDTIIEENQKALEKAGHWGVPTMAFQDEPFFGQDRIDHLIWRLKQHGLKKR
jgi:2-hydroxychromene-2-carboxylate isomerase